MLFGDPLSSQDFEDQVTLKITQAEQAAAEREAQAADKQVAQVRALLRQESRDFEGQFARQVQKRLFQLLLLMLQLLQLL